MPSQKMGKANVSKSELELIIISNRITIAYAQSFYDLGEVMHLTPKKTEMLCFSTIFYRNSALIKCHN